MDSRNIASGRGAAYGEVIGYSSSFKLKMNFLFVRLLLSEEMRSKSNEKGGVAERQGQVTECEVAAVF